MKMEVFTGETLTMQLVRFLRESEVIALFSSTVSSLRPSISWASKAESTRDIGADMEKVEGASG